MKVIVILSIVALLVNQVHSAIHEHCTQYDDDGSTCLKCRHNMYLHDGTCVEECPSTYVAKRRNWVFDYGRMVGNRCELPLNSENKFLVAWGHSSRGGTLPTSIASLKNITTIFSTVGAFAALTNAGEKKLSNPGFYK